MDGFFGIGFLELILLAVVALIVLGPERLPGVMREAAAFLRRVRQLSSEFTSQFREEFRELEDLNPRKLLNEVTDPKRAPAKPGTPVAGTPRPAPPKPLAPAVTPAPARTATASPAAVNEAPPEPSILPPARAAVDSTPTAESAEAQPAPAPEQSTEAA